MFAASHGRKPPCPTCRLASSSSSPHRKACSSASLAWPSASRCSCSIRSASSAVGATTTGALMPASPSPAPAPARRRPCTPDSRSGWRASLAQPPHVPPPAAAREVGDGAIQEGARQLGDERFAPETGPPAGRTRPRHDDAVALAGLPGGLQLVEPAALVARVEGGDTGAAVPTLALPTGDGKRSIRGPVPSVPTVHRRFVLRICGAG